jgi:hypothetical protein
VITSNPRYEADLNLDSGRYQIQNSGGREQAVANDSFTKNQGG